VVPDWIFAEVEQESWYAALEQQTNSLNVVNVNVADGLFHRISKVVECRYQTWEAAD